MLYVIKYANKKNTLIVFHKTLIKHLAKVYLKAVFYKQKHLFNGLTYFYKQAVKKHFLNNYLKQINYEHLYENIIKKLYFQKVYFIGSITFC